MSRFAVFGNRGYLGSQLAKYLVDRCVEVEGFDRPQDDVTSSSFWESFDPASYDAILFFAGMTGTERSFDCADQFLAVNVRGLLGLLKKLAPLGVNAPFVVFPSSRLVYKGVDCPLQEDAPKESRTVYAANKLACEALLEAYGIRYGIRSAVLRLCVPYGNLVTHDYSYGTLGFFLEQAEKGKITLFGDGSQKRTFSHVEDICEVVWRLASGRVDGTFNMGGDDLTLREVAEAIASARNAHVECVPWPEIAWRLESGSTYFDSTRIRKAVGIESFRLFREFVKDL